MSVYRQPPQKQTRVPVALLERLDAALGKIGAVTHGLDWNEVYALRAEVKARLLHVAECEAES